MVRLPWFDYGMREEKNKSKNINSMTTIGKQTEEALMFRWHTKEKRNVGTDGMVK